MRKPHIRRCAYVRGGEKQFWGVFWSPYASVPFAIRRTLEAACYAARAAWWQQQTGVTGVIQGGKK